MLKIHNHSGYSTPGCRVFCSSKMYRDTNFKYILIDIARFGDKLLESLKNAVSFFFLMDKTGEKLNYFLERIASFKNSGWEKKDLVDLFYDPGLWT